MHSKYCSTCKYITNLYSKYFTGRYMTNFRISIHSKYNTIKSILTWTHALLILINYESKSLKNSIHGIQYCDHQFEPIYIYHTFLLFIYSITFVLNFEPIGLLINSLPWFQRRFCLTKPCSIIHFYSQVRYKLSFSISSKLESPSLWTLLHS